ncbi:MAG: hypothetical protein ACR2Q3_01870 [Woeseiaceae bacterium]
MKTSTAYLVIWLISALIAVLMALNMLTAAYVDGNYIPVGNDSFYHARRILDAAIGERGFYQYDTMIHAPEGSWLNWPWAYDYLAALALSAALLINPALDPMAFLAHIPVFWLLINAGLLTLIGWYAGLRPAFAALMMFGFALSPLTQTMHGVGVIDHHFLELTFVLATVVAGLRYFSRGARPADAILFGAALGIAPAFHNGLFILQVPVLVCLLVSWIRAQTPAAESLRVLAGTLFVTTLVIALPSGPFRDLQFEFWTLSWFHLYIAGCTSACILFFTSRPFQKRNMMVLVGLGGVLAIPLFAKILIGAAFLSGELTIVQEVAEVQSPVKRLLGPGGVIWITTYYSWLFFITPVLVGCFALRVWRSDQPTDRYSAIFVVFGLLLMLAQFRFHPFGSWAILLGGLLLVQEHSDRLKLTTLASVGAAIMVVALAYQPAVKNRLFLRYPPGNNVDYAATRSLYPDLADACAEQAGLAISYNDDGHHVRYHTDCSVVSNNFLMTPQHEQKVVELDRLLQMDPEQLLVEAPHVDYVFARLFQIFSADLDGRVEPAPISHVISVNAPLFVALMFADELPDEYVLLDEVRLEDERDFAFGRVYKIVRD